MRGLLASAVGRSLNLERLEDGEVSTYLTEDVRSGDAFIVRGPLGGYFGPAP